MQCLSKQSTILGLLVSLACFFSLLLLSTPQLHALDPGNPIDPVVPETSFALHLEDVIRIPDSGGGGLGQAAARLQQMQPSGDGSGRLFVADIRGKIYHFMPGDSSPTLFFDVKQHIDDFQLGNQSLAFEDASNGRGLRSFEFHPQAFTPGTPGYRKFYTAQGFEKGSGPQDYPASVVEWTLNLNPNGTVSSVDTNSQRDVISTVFPSGGHPLGWMGFNPNITSTSDPDFGNLYISVGDGGNNAFPTGGQNRSTLHGSILRINPLQSGGSQYTVPSDNPFLTYDPSDDNFPGDPKDDSWRPEIWAYGLRNPLNMSWDRGGDGKMLIVDIGQSNIEEINLGAAGANYGWNSREGTYVNTCTADQTNCSLNQLQDLPAGHATDKYTYPVAQYDHFPDPTPANYTPDDKFSTAIAGGFVSRDPSVPELYGKYIFANFANDSRGPLYIVDADQLTQDEDFSQLENDHDGFLAPLEKLKLVDDGGQPVEMIDLIRDTSGNSNLERTDIRFGIGPNGEVYITNKRDGWIRKFVSTSADFDQDFDIDGADLLTWQAGLGLTSQTDNANGDANLDGTVNELDLAHWTRQYGISTTSAATPASQAVPEPTTFCLLTFGILVVANSSRR